jgi:hypothetical protein
MTRISWGALAAAIIITALPAAPSSAVAPTWRSGNPPVIQSATVDAQRRLVVTYVAADGVTYGGSVYLDSNPENGSIPPGVTGQFMYCNNNYSCTGKWALTATPETGPFTFTSPPLSATTFPAGQYWVQVETTNEDPYPSTRYWEPSNVVQVTVPAGTGSDDGDDARPAVRFRFAQITAYPGRLAFWVRCPNATHWRMSYALTKPNGATITSGVASGDKGLTGYGYQEISWSGYAGGPFTLTGSHVVCANEDYSRVATHRAPFSTDCQHAGRACGTRVGTPGGGGGD